MTSKVYRRWGGRLIRGEWLCDMPCGQAMFRRDSTGPALATSIRVNRDTLLQETAALAAEYESQQRDRRAKRYGE